MLGTDPLKDGMKHNGKNGLKHLWTQNCHTCMCRAITILRLILEEMKWLVLTWLLMSAWPKKDQAQFTEPVTMSTLFMIKLDRKNYSIFGHSTQCLKIVKEWKDGDVFIQMLLNGSEINHKSWLNLMEGKLYLGMDSSTFRFQNIWAWRTLWLYLEKKMNTFVVFLSTLASMQHSEIWETWMLPSVGMITTTTTGANTTVFNFTLGEKLVTVDTAHQLECKEEPKFLNFHWLTIFCN